MDTQTIDQAAQQRLSTFRKIGVFLNNSPADMTALAFASRFAAITGAEQLHVIRVQGGLEDELGPLPTAEEFDGFVKTGVPADVADRVVTSLRIEGAALAQVVRTARDEQLDLVVLGRRPQADQLGVGSIITKVARKCPCSVLVVPAYTHVHMSRMLAPVDCSAHSKMSLEVALDLARASGESNPQTLALCIYGVGYGYRYSGATLHQAGKKIEMATVQKLTEFLGEVDTGGVEFESMLVCSEDVPGVIHSVSAVSKMDLIVVGSQGVGSPATGSLGGTAEKIVESAYQPVLIVKRKGETESLLRSLLGR